MLSADMSRRHTCPVLRTLLAVFLGDHVRKRLLKIRGGTGR